MNLFENMKYFSITLIITLILGYYLGIAISTVVDYRLKDATINMPKPRNDITIVVSKKPKAVHIKDNSKNIEKFLNYKIKATQPKKNKKRKTKNKESSPNFKNYPYNPTQELRDKVYQPTTIDNDLTKYAKDYQTGIKNTDTDEKYKPYNSETISDLYKEVDIVSSPKTENVNPKPYNTLQKHNKKRAPKNYPSRRKLCPDFKCQRNYMTCTSNHIPKLSKKMTPDPRQI